MLHDKMNIGYDGDKDISLTLENMNNLVPGMWLNCRSDDDDDDDDTTRQCS